MLNCPFTRTVAVICWVTGPGCAPSAPAAGGHGEGEAHGSAAGAETLTAELKTADGTDVAKATIDFAGGFATVTVETTTAGELTPGFHGLHIHSVGKCEPTGKRPEPIASM